MGKGNRKRNIQTKKETKKETEKAEKRKRVIAFTAVFIAILFVAVCFVFLKASFDRKNALDKIDMMSSENYKVSGTMMNYYMSSVYSSVVDYYEGYLSSIGLDPQKKLKDQKFNDSKTWFEFISDSAVSQLEEYLVIAEAAREEGITLSESEEAALAERAHMMMDLEIDYGKGVTEEDIFDSLKLSAISAKYKEHLSEICVISEEDIEMLYIQNRYAYEKCSFIKYELKYGTEYIPDYETAKTYVNSLLATESDTEFTSLVKSILTDVMKINDANAEATVSGLKTENSYYDEDEPASEWLFGERKQFDTCMIDNKDGNSFYIYMITVVPEREIEKCVSVRHILVGNEENAAALLEKWKNGNATADEFSYLAMAYSTDSGSAFNGGLYEFVKKGQMVKEFDAWCFDSSRKVGDCDVIKTDYGYHVIYWMGESEEGWRSDVISSAKEDYITAKIAGFAQKYPITVNKEAINMLDL